MKCKLTKSQIIAIIVMTLLSCIVGAVIIRSIIKAKDYTFDLGILYSDLNQTDGSILISSDREYDQDTYDSNRFSLRRGSFRADVEYEAKADYSIYVSLDNDNNCTIPLAAGSGTATQIFELDWPTDRAYFSLDIPEDNTITIKRVSLHSDRPLYRDGFFQLIILLAIYAFYLFHVVRFESYSTDRKITILTLTGLIIIINLPLYVNLMTEGPSFWRVFDPLAPMTRFGIDTRGHLLRLEGVLYGILDGQYPVIISPNLLNECGELSFLNPDFFLYPFAMIRILGGSMLLAYRLVSVTVNICTVLASYYSFKTISDEKYRPLIFTIAYALEPHRLRVILEKGAAMGMAIPYIFMPICIAGIYLILKKEKKGMVLTAIGVSGILESHVTTLVLLCILIAILVLAFIREMIADGMKCLKLSLGSILIVLAMNLGMISIFLYYYISGVNTASLIWDSWTEYLLTGSGLLIDTESRYYLIGIPIALLIAVLLRRRVIEYKLGITLVVFAGLLFCMTSSFFPWRYLIDNISLFHSFTNYMQKPHRFYTVMAASLLMGVLLILKEQRINKKLSTGIIILAGITLLAGTGLKYAEYFSEAPLLYDQITGNMNTRQFYNYLPIGVDKSMEFSGVASLSDSDAVESLYYSKRGTHADYTYITDTEGIYAEFPLLTYAGYRAQDESGRDMEVIKGDRGRLTVYLTGDGAQHEIHVGFRVHPIFKLTYILSLAAAAMIILFYIRIYILKQRNRNTDDQHS